MPYHRMKLYVGIFVSFLIVSVSGLFYIIMVKKGNFEDHATFYFQTDNASSFFVGMPINYSGFQIGTINQLELTPQGKVKIGFSVKESNHRWICDNTLLMLEKPLIGTPAVAVITPNGAPMLKNGSELKMIIRDDINDVINNVQPILNELQQVLHSVNIIAADLAYKEGSLKKILANTERFSGKLASDQPLLTTVTGDPDATKALNSSLRQSKDVLKDIHALSMEIDILLQSIQHQIVAPTGQSVKTVNAIFLDVKKKLDTLDGTVAALGTYDKELVLLKNELHINLEKTHQLLEKVDAIMTDKHDNKVILP